MALILGVKTIMLSPCSYNIGFFLNIFLSIISFIYLILAPLRNLLKELPLAIWGHAFGKRSYHCGVFKF